MSDLALQASFMGVQHTCMHQACAQLAEQEVGHLFGQLHSALRYLCLPMAARSQGLWAVGFNILFGKAMNARTAVLVLWPQKMLLEQKPPKGLLLKVVIQRFDMRVKRSCLQRPSMPITNEPVSDNTLLCCG